MTSDLNHVLIITPSTGLDFDRIFDNDLTPKISLILPEHGLSDLTENSKRRIDNIIPIHDYFSQDVENTARILFKKTPFQRIILTSEDDVIRAASLRKELSLPGQNYDSALIFRNKMMMKDFVSQAGFKVPGYSSIEHLSDLHDFVEKKGFPIVIKPHSGSGCQNTFILANENELEDFIEKKFPLIFQPLKIEEYMSGDMYHIDGLLSNKGIIVAWPSKFMLTPLDLINGKNFGSYILDDNHPLFHRLINYTQKLLSVLPSSEISGFHLELFHQPDQDDFFLCEIAARIGGMCINTMWKYSFGLELETEFLKLQAGMTTSAASLKKNVICARLICPSREGYLNSLPALSSFPWVEEYIYNANQGEKLPKVNELSDFLLSVVFVADSEGRIIERFSILDEWIKNNVVIH